MFYSTEGGKGTAWGPFMLYLTEVGKGTPWGLFMLYLTEDGKGTTWKPSMLYPTERGSWIRQIADYSDSLNCAFAGMILNLILVILILNLMILTSDFDEPLLIEHIILNLILNLMLAGFAGLQICWIRWIVYSLC